MAQEKHPSTPAPRRRRIPYDLQVRVMFRDKWLCSLCKGPAIFAPTFKYIDKFVKEAGWRRPTAYHAQAWRRDTAPLLLENAAIVEHVRPLARGGTNTENNLRLAHHTCNLMKSARELKKHLKKHPIRPVVSVGGEPEHWDGCVSLFMVLAKAHAGRLTDSEESWYRSFEKYFSEETRLNTSK